MNDDRTLDRLRDIANRLTERLVDAEIIRARLTKARLEANTWPDLRSGRMGDIPDLPHLQPPDGERHRH